MGKKGNNRKNKAGKAKQNLKSGQKPTVGAPPAPKAKADPLQRENPWKVTVHDLELQRPQWIKQCNDWLRNGEFPAKYNVAKAQPHLKPKKNPEAEQKISYVFQYPVPYLSLTESLSPTIATSFSNKLHDASVPLLRGHTMSDGAKFNLQRLLKLMDPQLSGSDKENNRYCAFICTKKFFKTVSLEYQNELLDKYLGETPLNRLLKSYVNEFHYTCTSKDSSSPAAEPQKNTRGLKHHCPLTRYLSLLMVDPLHRELQKQFQDKFHVVNPRARDALLPVSLQFPTGIVLISRNPEGLQAMLNHCQEYFLRHSTGLKARKSFGLAIPGYDPEMESDDEDDDEDDEDDDGQPQIIELTDEDFFRMKAEFENNKRQEREREARGEDETEAGKPSFEGLPIQWQFEFHQSSLTLAGDLKDFMVQLYRTAGDPSFLETESLPTWKRKDLPSNVTILKMLLDVYKKEQQVNDYDDDDDDDGHYYPHHGHSHSHGHGHSHGQRGYQFHNYGFDDIPGFFYGGEDDDDDDDDDDEEGYYYDDDDDDDDDDDEDGPGIPLEMLMHMMAAMGGGGGGRRPF